MSFEAATRVAGAVRLSSSWKGIPICVGEIVRFKGFNCWIEMFVSSGLFKATENNAGIRSRAAVS